ncbi:hypothetical protein LguiB_007909 [Lonicera macranthoides]
MLQTQITEVHKRLSCWSNPDTVDNIEQLSQMEDSLRASLNRLHMHKESFTKHQLVPLDCTTQFHNGMHLPLMMGGTQEAQPLSWLPGNENQHMILPEEPNFLPQREIKCSRDASLPSYSGFFESAKHTEIDNIGQVDNTRQEGVSLSNMNSLNLQIDDRFAYNPFSNLNLPEAKELNPGTEPNLLGNHHVDYQINSNSELPSSIYDNVHHNNWFPESGHCDISIFNDSSYSQQPSQF